MYGCPRRVVPCSLAEDGVFSFYFEMPRVWVFTVLGRSRFFGLGSSFEVHPVLSKIGNRMIRRNKGVVETIFLDRAGIVFILVRP